jgi:hypothetical protein
VELQLLELVVAVAQLEILLALLSLPGREALVAVVVVQ